MHISERIHKSAASLCSRAFLELIEGNGNILFFFADAHDDRFITGSAVDVQRKSNIFLCTRAQMESSSLYQGARPLSVLLQPLTHQ